MSQQNSMRHPVLRAIAISLASLIGMAILVTLSLPSVLNTAWGRERLVAWIDHTIPGSLSIQSMQLSWFSGQEVRGLVLYDQEGNTVLSLDRLSSSALPHYLLRRTSDIGVTQIDGLKAELKQDQAGLTNLHKALGISHESWNHDDVSKAKPRSAQIVTYLPFTGSIVVGDSTLSWHAQDLKPLEITDLFADVRIPAKKGSADILIRGISRQQELQGEFLVKAKAEGFGSKSKIVLQRNAEGWLLPVADARLQFEVTVKRLAVDVLDRLLTLNHPYLTGSITEALGPALDLSLAQTLTRNGNSIALQANSRNLQARLETLVKEGKVALKEPGQISWAITPQFANLLLPLATESASTPLQLATQTTLQATIERFDLLPNQSNEERFWSPLRLRWKLAEVQLSGHPTIGLIRLRNVGGVFERLPATRALLIHLQANLDYAGQLSSLQVDGKANDLIALSGDLNIQARDLSSKLLDHLLDGQGIYSTAIGPTIDINLAIDANNDDILADVQVRSENLTLPSTQVAIGPMITLRKPAQMHYSLTPDLLDKLSSGSGPRLTGPTPLLLTLKHLNLPARFSTSEVDGALVLSAEVAAGPIQVTDLLRPGEGAVRISNLKAKIDSSSPPTFQYQVTGNIAPDISTPQLVAALGRASSVDISGQISVQDGQIQKHLLDIVLNSDLVDLRAKTAIIDNKRLTLLAPAKIEYTLQPEALKVMGLVSDQLPQLTAPAMIDLVVDALTVSLAPFNLDTLNTRGSGSLREVDIKDPHTNVGASLKDLAASWNFDGAKQAANLTLKGITSLDSTHTGRLEVVATASGWKKDGQVDWAQATLDANGSLLRLPVAFAAAAFSAAELPTLLGPSLDVYFNAKMQGGADPGRGNIEFSFSGEGLSGGFALRTGDKIELKRNASNFEWKITPARFAALQRMLTAAPPSWAISDTTTLRMNVSDLLLGPQTGKGDSPWAHLSAKATAAIDPATLMHLPTKTKNRFDQLSVTLETRDLAESLAFNMRAQESTSQTGPAGDLQIQGKVDRLYTEGQWQSLASRNLTLRANGRQLPLSLMQNTPLLDRTSSEYIRVFLGERLNTDLHIEKNANENLITAHVAGQDNTRLTLDGRLANEYLTLRQPLVVEFAMTPEIGQTILADLLPLFQTALSSNQLIKLTIDPKGFKTPLRGASDRTVQIEKATLDLGRVEFHDSGQLASVVSLLDSSKGSGNGQFSVWFTPLYFSLLDGVFRIERIDALIANLYPIAVWGKVDLPKDKVNVAIGVAAQSLRTAYGIGNLDPSYMLVLSLTGTTKNASIDKARAATRITSLVAQSKGGPQGLILGGVLDLIGGGFDEKRIPPPTAPIPWQETASASSPQASKQESPESRTPLKKIQKGIQEGASQILNLFR